MAESDCGTLIVTGAGRGIGAAVATLAGARGYRVAVNYASDERSATKVVETIEGAGGKAIAIQGNVSREDDVLRLFETAERKLGPISALVNNAGITGGLARVADVTASILAEVMAVNVAGSILCAREAVRRLSKSTGGPGGAIVNISSLAARTGGGGEWVHYGASKGAINTFTIGLAREVGEEGIRVNAVAPGLIATDIHAASGDPGRPDRMAPSIPLRRAGSPEEVAAGVLWLLSAEASYVTGSILEIGGGR